MYVSSNQTIYWQAEGVENHGSSPWDGWMRWLPCNVGILWRCSTNQPFENQHMSSLGLQRPVKVKKEGQLEGQNTIFCCRAPVPWASPQCCFMTLSTWTVMWCVCPSQAPTRSFRNCGRAENYQHLRSLAWPHTAKQCVFCWYRGSLTATEDPQVLPASFRHSSHWVD